MMSGGKEKRERRLQVRRMERLGFRTKKLDHEALSAHLLSAYDLSHRLNQVSRNLYKTLPSLTLQLQKTEKKGRREWLSYSGFVRVFSISGVIHKGKKLYKYIG